MIDLTNDVHIKRPVETVWSTVGDPTRWHRWRGAMTAPAERPDEGQVEAGMVFSYRSAFMGREVETEMEVVAYEAGCQIAVTADKPVPVRFRFRCEAAGDRTRVVQETQGEVGGFFGVAEPLIKPLMKRQFQKDLDALKAMLEDG
ncbi:MAG: SRPBCC family protein [Candidatus Promineifilaceae bacterium]|nr:SRPBCC family protein [Candidatus Promineifilaceae bacterium]